MAKHPTIPLALSTSQKREAERLQRQAWTLREISIELNMPVDVVADYLDFAAGVAGLLATRRVFPRGFWGRP